MPWESRRKIDIENPQEETRHRESMKIRGEKLINAWFDNYRDNDTLRLQLKIGYATDAETQERLGAVVSVVINDNLIADFTRAELQCVLDFLRYTHEAMDSDAPGYEEYREDAQGFFDSLQDGIDAAAPYENNALN